MDTTLVIVAVLSMGMAAALSVIVWRLLREERRRTDARVAALAAAAQLPDRTRPVAPVAEAPAVLVMASSPARRAFTSDLTPAHRVATPVVTEARRVAEVSEAGRHREDLPLNDSSPSTAAPAVAPLFEEPVRETPWWNRVAVMTALALVGATILLFALTASKTPQKPGVTADASAHPAAAPIETTNPGLELLSLRDARTATALSITGMVRNPRSGSLRSRVVVTVYAFDEKGAFLASARAPIDVTSLTPGDESPFVVTVPLTENVARYRIGFRGEDGRVIAHVDKRQPGPTARLAQPRGSRRSDTHA